MRANFEVLHVPYDGNRLKFFMMLKARLNNDVTNCLFRASEKCELWRVLLYGTDRGGHPPKTWQDGKTPFEEVIYATTEEDIMLGECYPEKSSSLKKFDIIKDPVLLIYEQNAFRKVEDRQWQFHDGSKHNKLRVLTHVVFIDMV